MRINNNIPALNTHRLLNVNTNNLQKSLEKLSSGKRINRASDDAAGMAISQKMESQIKGLRQASRNSLDGISMIQTAEGALNEIHEMLQRMNELSVQGANGVNGSDDLKAIKNEIDQLTEQIGKIASDTDFNGISLLDGTAGSGFQIQVGAGSGQFININMENIKADPGTLSISGIITDASSGADYQTAITKYQTAINTISAHRSQFGAFQNRLEHTIRNIDNTAENLTSSKSRIEDLDMAQEMSEYTKNNILQQAGTSMLSQANQLPQSVLQLLQR